MTLLEQYNQRKGAETGKPASASAQTKPAVNKPRTLLEQYNERRGVNTIQPVYSQAQRQGAPAQPGTLLEQYQQRQQQNLYTRALQRQQPQNLYAQAAENAARGIGGLLGEIYDAAEERQSNLYSGAYAQILRRGDYAQQSGAGESRLNLGGDTDRRYDYINDINGYRARVDEDAMLIGDTQRMGKYAFMTKDEVGVYNYLYATQGRNAADSYLDELEPELDKQWYSGMRASTLEDAMQSSADKAWYSAMSVLQQPIRSVNSAMQNLEDALDTAQGREINPYSELRQASRLTQDVRGEIAGQMSDVGSFAYQTAMSAGDSAVNAIIAKGLGGLTGATGDALMKATNLIGSLTMSSEVMSLAVAENKEKGYSDAGALALGLIRGAVEYASEAMGGEWVIKNVKKNPMNFVKTMVLNMIPEGVEEVMSDAMNGAVNLLVDQIFGTEESGWPKLINDFKANGTEWQKKNPELAAMLAILGEEGLSFLGGAFATFGSSGVQYTTNLASISRTAQQLHTTAESVAQLMETYDAESAGQIEALAQIFDADSVEDFTRKMADNRTAEAALDAIMRGQENENAAPEGTADMEGVFSNGEQGYDRGSENRDAAVGAGGEGIDNEGRARALRMDAGNEGGQRSDRFQDLVREEVTPAALGVANGSAGQTVQVLDENRFEAGSPEAQAARRARQNGLEPVFIKGTMQVGEGENAKQARAYIVGNRVMLQADGNVNADQLLNHELYHQAAQRDPRLNDMLRSALAENMTEEELGALVDRYIQAYDGVYDFSDMTAEQIAAICEEELFADLYAGIDNTGRQELRESAQRGFSEAQTMQPQNAEAERDTRGPPEGRASYAGPKARTANSTTLQQAEQMEREGRSSEEIRRETGWFKGRDGQWRFEIDDSGARYYRSGDARFRNDHPEYARYQDLMSRFLTGSLSTDELVELQQLEQTWGREQNRLKGLVDSGHATLDMLLDHPALFEAYPQLREARIRFAELGSGERGSYNPRTNTITLSNEVRSASEDTLIHEIQHVIQAAEGFSGGASVEYWMDQGYSREEAERRYRSTAGEIEARDAVNRRSMTEEERKKTSPDLGDENTVFAESQSAVSFEKRADLDSLDIPWDSDNTSTIKEQVVRNLDRLNSLEPVTTVDYDKNTQKQYYEQLDGILKSRFGYRIDRQGFGSFLFDKNAVNTLRHYVGSDAEAAAAIASPYVLKRGEIISGHRNHNNGQYPSVTFAAPVVLNGEKGIEAVTVLFADKDRVHSLRVLAPDGTEFVLMPIKNETELEMAGVDAKAKITQPTSSVSDNSIRSSSENSNPQNEGRASVEVGGENRSLAELRRENGNRQKENRSFADGMADGEFKGIDIMPGEGEEAVSSANGLTEEDNRRLDRGFLVSDLFGPTNAQKERAATEKAAKAGNDALREFAESMPEDPMDLYGDQNPVTSRKESGDGSRNIPGRGKISAAKEAERKTLGQKAYEGWHRFLRSMVNEGDAVHQIGIKTGNRAIDGMYFYAKAATMRAQQWIQKQRTSFDTRTTGKSLNDIFDPIRAKGDGYYEKFQLYLYHRLNVERMSRSAADAIRVVQETVSRLAAVNPDIAAMTDETLAAKARQYQEGGGLGFDEENSELIYEYWQAKQELRRAEKARNKPIFDYEVDAEQSEKSARDLLAANPEFDELAQEVYDYCDALLQYRVDAGLITAEDMAKLKSTYPHYVPVMYEMAEEAADKVHKGNVSVSTTVKSAKGGTTKLLPLHYALARQTLAVMRNAGYQQLGSAVLSEYEQNREIMDRYVSDVAENDAVWDESMADNDDVNVPYENVIGIFRDGKRYDITLSEDLSYAFQSLQGKNGPQDLKMAMSANNLFKKLCTAYNPLFMITNPIRDVQDALFYSTDTKRWMKNYPKAIAQIAGSGKYWQMYQSLGGVQNSYFDWATGEQSVKMGKVEALNLAIEQAPRLAEFMTVLENAQRKNGEITQADRMEAFNAAAEITTNFSRGGTMGKWVNRNLVPFWNPGVQGLSKAVRTVTETRSFKAWAGLALKAAALGMLPELLNGLLYRDDDEWDVIDDQMKMEYYLFKTSDGVWIKIPKGRVLAALSMPVVGVQESLRGDEVDWSGLARSAFGSVAPNNPFETNLLSTLMQAKLTDPDDPGKTWYGGDIESRRLQSYAPGERYDESTDIISKWLGGKLGISPKKLSYVIDQYSGVLGDLILPYLTPKAERGLYVGGVAVPLSNAFMSRFTMDTVTSNTISNEYYGLLDELGYAAKDGDKPSAVAERYLNRAGGMVSDFYARIREIENDETLSDAEKSKLTRELRKQLNEYEQQITADAGRYLETARQYMDDHPEFDYTDDSAVNAFIEGYNSMQTDEKYYIDADRARTMMKDEVYREVNREHFGAEYALQVYSKDVYENARSLNAECGLTYEDYYDFYFGKRYLYADKDEDGNSISGSKKEKIVALIDGMDITDEQKDALYLASGYTEKSLRTTPWHGGNGKYASTRRGSRGGGRRSKRGSSRTSVHRITSGKTKSSVGSGIDISELFGGGGSGKKQNSADASRKLLEIVNRHYGGDEWAAAMDGGRKARTKVDFKL